MLQPLFKPGDTVLQRQGGTVLAPAAQRLLGAAGEVAPFAVGLLEAIEPGFVAVRSPALSAQLTLVRGEAVKLVVDQLGR